VTLVMHNDQELWEIRGSGLAAPPYYNGGWSEPKHSVDYFTGFTSGIGGYTTDFVGQALDFSLITSSFDDPLRASTGSFQIQVSADTPGGATEVTGSISAQTDGGRTLVGTFMGTVAF